MHPWNIRVAANLGKKEFFSTYSLTLTTGIPRRSWQTSVSLLPRFTRRSNQTNQSRMSLKQRTIKPEIRSIQQPGSVIVICHCSFTRNHKVNGLTSSQTVQRCRSYEDL